MSYLSEVHYETAQLHAQSPSAQLHAQSPSAQLHAQSPSAPQTNKHDNIWVTWQDPVQIELNWIE